MQLDFSSIIHLIEGVFRVLKLSHDGKEMTNDKDTGNSKDDNTDREEGETL